MVYAIIGGVIIGVAVSIMLVFNGRVTGISGIVAGIMAPLRSDISWRVLFVAGLISGGLILNVVYPEAFMLRTNNMTLIDYALAGLLVGFGTVLGNGCTSGHGVCGISRFSMRSVIATIVFITFGVVSVMLFKFFKGGL